MSMQAMQLKQVGKPLELVHLPIPSPKEEEVLIQVHLCALCRTDLHIADGELPAQGLPRILGHQIIGHIAKGNSRWKEGTRVGVCWLAHTCDKCPFCLSGRENLCDFCRHTGWHVDGGFAEYTVAHQDFIFPIPETYTDIQAAPLMCAGVIGLRALRLAGPCQSLGFFGFGASAHLLHQIAYHRKIETYVFTRPGSQSDCDQLAHSLNATWVGTSDQLPPKPLDAAIVFASAGHLVPQALKSVNKGGTVVCAGIHMSDIPSFPYRILWEERLLRSVANLTRQDVRFFFEAAKEAPVRATVTPYPLSCLNEAMDNLRSGALTGAAVIIPSEKARSAP